MPELRRRRIDLARLDCVFITHLHADHVFGIPFLLLEYRIRAQRAAPIVLVGPPGLAEFVETLCRLAWRGICAQGSGSPEPATYIEVAAEEEFSVGEARVVAYPMAHYGLPAFGYRITWSDRTIAYSGDTGPCASLDALVEGVDVAILEMTHPDSRTDPGHLDPREVARLAAPLASRGARVLVTHTTGRPRPMAGVTFCRPGKTYRV